MSKHKNHCREDYYTDGGRRPSWYAYTPKHRAELQHVAGGACCRGPLAEGDE